MKSFSPTNVMPVLKPLLLLIQNADIYNSTMYEARLFRNNAVDAYTITFY